MINATSRPKILASKRLASSWRIGFYEDVLQIGDSKPVPYARITHPNFAMVAAVRQSDGKMPLVKQYRHGAGMEFWELPAGLIEENERPEDCIRREFQEEVGYDLLDSRLVTRAFPCPSRSPEAAYIFSGKVGKRSRKRLDSNEVLSVRFVSNSLALKLLSHSISATDLLAYLLCTRLKK